MEFSTHQNGLNQTINPSILASREIKTLPKQHFVFHSKASPLGFYFYFFILKIIQASALVDELFIYLFLVYAGQRQEGSCLMFGPN